MAYIPLKFKRGQSANFTLDKVPHETGNVYLLEDINELHYDRGDGERLKITDTSAIFYLIEGEEEFEFNSYFVLGYGILGMSMLA